MKITQTSLPDVLLIEPKVFGDERGFFYESFSQRIFNEAVGREVHFVQDNHSKSQKGVLRGLHYQIQNTQGKLVRVTEGEVFDVAVDIRRSSPTFGKWVGIHISAENRKQLWVPEGFAHGFITLSKTAEFLYKTTSYYSPEYDRCILWNDDSIGVAWPINVSPTLSAKDQAGKKLLAAEVFA
jgi:dTDP-4-dehydrorhamnose 3,5-epimerase